MKEQKFLALAERCRELHRSAVLDEVREQLRHWTIEFEAEAEADREAQGHGVMARDGK